MGRLQAHSPSACDDDRRPNNRFLGGADRGLEGGAYHASIPAGAGGKRRVGGRALSAACQSASWEYAGRGAGQRPGWFPKRLAFRPSPSEECVLMAVGVYVRVSTEEQRERQSIATQREFAVRYCELHQLAVHEVYADDGVSGTVPLEMRAAGIRLLEDARRAKFDQLLVFKLDRLGRDTRLILNNVAELEKHGVRVRSMTEEFDTATATGRLMLTMLSGFAAHERELIRERSVAGTKRLAEAGAWLGGIVPYGYRKRGERGQSRIVISDEPPPGSALSEAEVVRTIYR